MKAYLRGQIISYSAQQRKRHNMKLEQLTNDILKLDTTLAVTPSDNLFKLRLTLSNRVQSAINKTN